MKPFSMTTEEMKAEIAAVLQKAQNSACVEVDDVEELYQKLNIYHEELEYQNEELKRVSADLEQARSYLTDLYESAPVAYITFDKDLRILSSNRAFRLLFNVADHREVQTPWNAHLTADSQDTFYFHQRALVETGTAAPCRVAVQKGSRFWHLKLESNRQTGGPNPEFRSTLTDLTREHESETSLRISEARFRGIVNYATDGILLADANARIVEWNPQMAVITGWSAGEALGRFLWELQFDVSLPEEKTPDHLEKLHQFTLAYLKNFNEGTKPVTHQRTLQHRDGSVRTIDFTIFTLLADKERLIGCLFRDLTTALRLQEDLNQAKKTEAIGLLAGGIAHDFNNLLGIIFGRLEMAKLRPGITSALEKDLAQIEKAARHSADMTRQLLTYARKQVAMAEPLWLNQTIALLMPLLIRLVGDQVTIETAAQDDLPPILMDPSQLSQILTNLCANARDAMEARGLLRIRTRASGGNDMVELVVEDTGCGMDAATRSHLFEPFFTTKKLGHGTGLGLATVQGIVYQNRGQIRIDSEVGKGTVVTVGFPAHRIGSSLQVPPRETAVQGVLRSCRILVVDDEPEILEFVVVAVESWGHRSRAAGSAEEALVVLGAEQAFDLLITDVQLPGQSGQDLAVQALALHPQLRVLFMSGFSGDLIGQGGILPGRIHFLQKPFDMAALHARVDAVLAG